MRWSGTWTSCAPGLSTFIVFKACYQFPDGKRKQRWRILCSRFNEKPALHAFVLLLYTWMKAFRISHSLWLDLEASCMENQWGDNMQFFWSHGKWQRGRILWRAWWGALCSTWTPTWEVSMEMLMIFVFRFPPPAWSWATRTMTFLIGVALPWS